MSLFIFPNELKLQPKIPQISRKVRKPSSEAVFANFNKWTSRTKIIGSSPGYLSCYKKSFLKISTIKWLRKKICRETKNSNLIVSFSTLGEISHMVELRMLILDQWKLNRKNCHNRISFSSFKCFLLHL